MFLTHEKPRALEARQLLVQLCRFWPRCPLTRVPFWNSGFSGHSHSPIPRKLLGAWKPPIGSLVQMFSAQCIQRKRTLCELSRGFEHCSCELQTKLLAPQAFAGHSILFRRSFGRPPRVLHKPRINHLGGVFQLYIGFFWPPLKTAPQKQARVSPGGFFPFKPLQMLRKDERDPPLLLGQGGAFWRKPTGGLLSCTSRHHSGIRVTVAALAERSACGLRQATGQKRKGRKGKGRGGKKEEARKERKRKGSKRRLLFVVNIKRHSHRGSEKTTQPNPMVCI